MKVKENTQKKPGKFMSKNKKKKLPKSSSSNPATKKFREAAKRAAHHRHLLPLNTGKVTAPLTASHGFKGVLTLEALEKHNESVGGFTEASMQDDSATVGGTTFNTWATNLTGCTNATFRGIHRYINSNSSVQKEILAVLAAVTEVIKENGGEGKDLQYFGTLVTGLENADRPEEKMAMAHLLSIVIKRVPVSVLQKQFSQVEKTLYDVLTECVKQQTISPIKPILLSLASLLRVQDINTWLEKYTERAFNAMLAFITHKKPKLRKAAHTAVKIVLRGSLFMLQTPSPPFHPAARLTAQFCEKQIESYKGQSNKVEVLHILYLLKDVLCLFPASNVKSLCEIILRLMRLIDLVVQSSCMEVLYKLFSSKPNSQRVPAEINAQILTALYDYQPSEKDGQPMLAWLRVMEASTINLACQDVDLAVSHLPRLFSTCMTCLLSDRQDVSKAAVSTMQALLQQCLDVSKDKLVNEASNNTTFTALQKVVKTLETGLSYQFHSMWSLVFQLWSTAFLVLGKIVPKMLLKCLTSMGDLRDTPHFSFKGEMDHAIGCAIKSMGPRMVLDAIPLRITGENDNLEFPRGWLLPLIRDNVGHTELGFFASYFLPLAAKFKTKAEEFSREQRVAESKAYEALNLQVWSMLKGFCDHPVDLKQSFQKVAKILGTALNDKEDLKMDVMASLRSLISCSLDNEADKAEVGKFAKNFLPILFNLFTGEGVISDGTRLAVLETIKKYLLVSDKELIYTFMDKCLEKIGQLDAAGFRNIALLDLAIAMIPYADSPRLRCLFQLALDRLQSENRTIQKKSYRILEEICSGITSISNELLSTNLSVISDTLLQSLSRSSPSSKAPRLRCLMHVYKNLQHPNLDFFMATLPEAILCTKEIGAKARAAAFDLVIVMTDTYIKWHPNVSEKENLGSVITKILAALAGTPHMISAALLALSRIVYHYKEKLIGSVLDNMIDTVIVLLASKTREIIKTALGFIKVILSAYQNTVLASHLKDLLNSLHGIAVKGNMRRLTKIIYSKLVKKFGYELVLSMTKSDVHKLLKNIHKSNERVKKEKDGKEGSDDEEGDESEEEEKFTTQPESIDDLLRDTDSDMDEGDDDQVPKLSKKTRKTKQGKGAWLMETGEDEIVDFMDPAAAKQVIATRPNANKKGEKAVAKDGGFKMTADGRLIITQDEEEQDVKKTKGNKSKPDSDEDELEDLFNAISGEMKAKARKRKHAEAAGDDDDENEASSSKYHAGGSGIHRPIAKANKALKEKQEFGQQYKAKKAQGDIKKRGMPDPYAYVPLNISSLNKRKQMKVKGSFKNLVKGAKRGAAKGMKAKVHKKKR
ncbi:RRP12-like protein [Physella acuta]|uniref:RRP12-like protein n=1 Tax=Physella acuta TaxID=109671 RepID=UPI0027DB3DF8|nr:RRP12-like protein [Physella acuta]